MRTMLLSLKADVYQKVLSGEKIYEHRKVFPDEPIKAYIYVSKPTKSICGIMFLSNKTSLLDWKEKYKELLDTLEAKLSVKVKDKMFIEVIFMTYSYIHRAINNEAFPHAPELYSKEYMIGRGRGKYWYRQNIRDDGEEFLRAEITKRFPKNEIIYFC